MRTVYINALYRAALSQQWLRRHIGTRLFCNHGNRWL